MIKRPKKVERSQKKYLTNEKYQDYAENQFKEIYDYFDKDIEENFKKIEKEIEDISLEKIIYENSSGTSGTVSFTENISVGDRIKIYGYIYRSSGEHKISFCEEIDIIVLPIECAIFQIYVGAVNSYLYYEFTNVQSSQIVRGAEKIFQNFESGGGTETTNSIFITKVIKI